MASFRYLNLNKSLSSSSSTGSEMTAPFSTTDITMASHSSECRSKGLQNFSQTSRLRKDLTLSPIASSCSFHDSLSVHKGDRTRKRGKDAELYTDRPHESNSTSLITGSKKSRSSSSDSSQIIVTYEKRNSCRSGAQSEKLLSRREAWPDHGTDREAKHESRSESKIEYFTSWIKNNPDQKLEERLIRRYAWRGDETPICRHLDQPQSGQQKKNLCDDLKIEDLEEGSTLCLNPAITKANHKCEVSLLPNVYGLKLSQSFSDSVYGKDIVPMHRNTIVLPPLSENCKVLEKEDRETPYFPSLAGPFTLDSSECLDGLKERLPWPKKVDKTLQNKWRDVAITLPSVKGTYKKRKILRFPHGMNRHAHVSLMHLEQPNNHGDVDENRDNGDKELDRSDGALPKETSGAGPSVQEVERENTYVQNRGADLLSDSNNRKKTSPLENDTMNEEKRKSSETNVSSDEIPHNQKEQCMLSDLVIHYESQESDSKSVNELLTASDVSKISLSSSHVSETFPTSGTDEDNEICREKGKDLPTFLSQCSHVGKQECISTDTFRDNTIRYDCENQESTEPCSKKYSITESNGGLLDGVHNPNQTMNNQCYIRDLEIVFSTNNTKGMEIQYSNTTARRLKSDEKVQSVSKDSNPMTYPESPTNLKNYKTVSLPQDSKLKIQTDVTYVMSMNAEETGNEIVKTENGRNSEVHQDDLIINQVSYNSSHPDDSHRVENISHQEHGCSSNVVKSEEQSSKSTPFIKEQDKCREIDDKSKNEPTLKSQLYCDKEIGFGDTSPKEGFIETPDFHNFSLTHNINEVENSTLSEPSCTSDKLILEKQSPFMRQQYQRKEIVEGSKNEVALERKLQREKTMSLREGPENKLLLNLSYSPIVSDTHPIKEVEEIFDREVDCEYIAKESKLDRIFFTHEQDESKEIVEESKNEVMLTSKLNREKTMTLKEGSDSPYSPNVSDPNSIKEVEIVNGEIDCECIAEEPKLDNIYEERTFFMQKQEIVEEPKNEVMLTIKLQREKTRILGEEPQNKLSFNPSCSPNVSVPHSIKEEERFDRETNCEYIVNESKLDQISEKPLSFLLQLDQRKERVDESKSELSIRRTVNCEKTISLEETTLCNACKEYKPLLQKQLFNECTNSEKRKKYTDSKITIKRNSDSRKRPFSSTTMFSHNFKRSKKEITAVSSFNSEQNISQFREVELCNRIKVKRDLRSTKFHYFEKEKSLSITKTASITAMESGERTETDLVSLSMNKEIQCVCNEHTLEDTTRLNSHTEDTTSHKHQSDLFCISVHSQSFQSIQQRDVIQSDLYRRSATRRSNSALQEDFGTSHNSEGNLGHESNGWETLESESGNLETVKNVSEWLEKSQNGKRHDISIRTNYASGVLVSENQISKESDDPSSVGCTTTSRSTSSYSRHNDSANDDCNSTTHDVALFDSSDSRCERRRSVGGGGDDHVSSATRSDDRKRCREWRTEGRRRVLKRRKKKVVARERSARCRRVLPPPLISAPPPSARRRRHPVFSLPSATPLFEHLATSSESINSLRMFDGSRKFPRRHFKRYLGRGDFLFKDHCSSENSLINTRLSHDKNSLLRGSGRDQTSKTSGDSSESYHCACETRRQALVSSCNPRASMLPVSPELTMINELESRRYIRSFPRKRKGSQTVSKSFSEFQTIKRHLAANPNALGAYFVPVPIIQPRGTWTRRSTPILTPASRGSSSSKMHDGNGFVSLQGPKHGLEGHVITPSLVPVEAVMPMAMALPQFVMPLPWQEPMQPSASCRSPTEGISHSRTDWLSQNHTLSRTGPTVLHFFCLQPMAEKRSK